MDGKKKKRGSAKARRGASSFVDKAVLATIQALDDGSEVPGVLCENCHEKPAKTAYTLITYDSPWADKSVDKSVCGPECMQKYFFSTEFHYFECPDCKRYIRSYNPLYPLEEHYVEEDGWKICLRCHEDTKG